MDLEQVIYEEIKLIAAESGAPVEVALARSTGVFESGLDSLGFAVLVAKLEERLGFDPFVAMAEPVYPATLGEFIDVYASHQARL